MEGAGGSVINSELGWRVSTGQSWAGLVAQCQEDREVASPGLLVKGLEEESERSRNKLVAGTIRATKSIT